MRSVFVSKSSNQTKTISGQSGVIVAILLLRFRVVNFKSSVCACSLAQRNSFQWFLVSMVNEGELHSSTCS